MEHYDSDSPATSESQTQNIPSRYISSRAGENTGGSAPMSGMMPQMHLGMMQQPQIAGMMQQKPQMAGMMPGYYNLPGMMPGNYNMPGMMMAQMQQMSGMPAAMPGSMPQMQQMSGMIPQMQPGMIPQMQPGMMMPQIQQGATTAAGGSRQGVPQSPMDNVYRPYMDLLCNDSPQPTSLETQFPGVDLFSFEELGMTPRTSPATQPAEPPART